MGGTRSLIPLRDADTQRSPEPRATGPYLTRAALSMLGLEVTT